MSLENVISAHNLSKSYRIWENPARRLFNPILAECGRVLPGAIGRAISKRSESGYRDFFALDNVEFAVKPGEAVGIMGRNGAGKSTLLQLIAKTLQPSSGSIEVHGRVAALLELGAGFNLDFTGRENVFLSGAILGLSQKEMESRFDEVAAFAEIGDFIDQPVKTYSSGMMMRLAFAVNTCVDPDILIVDEALSVGDAPFQSKCFRRLRQLTEQGVSLLFVSHDLGTVRSICSRALWLKDGKTAMWGEAKTVSKEYEKFCWQEQGVSVGDAPARKANHNSDETSSSKKKTAVDRSGDSHQVGMLTRGTNSVAAESIIEEASLLASLLDSHNFLLPVTDPTTKIGNDSVELERLVAINEEGEPTRIYPHNGKISLCYKFRAHRSIDSDFIIGIRFRDTLNNYVYSVQNLKSIQHLKLEAGETVYATIDFRVPLTHGDYIIRTGIFGFQNGEALVNGEYDFGRSVVWDVREDALHLQILPHKPMLLAGPVHVHGRMAIHQSKSN